MADVEMTPVGGPRAKLLEDIPTDTDEFAGGGHTAAAEAIASVVCTEPGGRVLGLQGAWGSGKSTIIALLRSELEVSQGTRGDQVGLFTYDAWAHQGDPLRRSFLEQLLAQLLRWNWIDEATHDAEVGKLSGRVSVEKTKTSVRLTREGLLTSLATLLIPAGAAVFANHLHHWHLTLMWVGVALMLAPLLIVLGFFVTGVTAKRFRPEGHSANSPRFSFFAKEQETETSTERIEKGDPTSVEFEDIFARTLSDCLTDGRRLVIVLDNLDRVEQPTARAVIATMQTFTGTTNYRRHEAWTSRVWTLVPFDLSGLERLWQGLPDDTSEPDPHEDEHFAPSGTAAAFFEKIFEVRISVPPLVLSDWHAYLLKLLRIAFPTRPEGELSTIVRLRNFYPIAYPTRAVASEQPTPRQLKQFVNQIVAVVLQRDDIPLAHIGFYVLLQRDSCDIRNFTEVAPAIRFLLGDEILTDIAALYFGTQRELAQQLRMRDRLERALVIGDSEAAGELATHPGFIETLESLDLDRWAKSGAVELTRSVSALHRAGLLTDPRLAPWITGPLRYEMNVTALWLIVDDSTGLGIAALCSTADPKSATNVLKKIAMPTEDAAVSDALAGLAQLGTALETANVPFEGVRVPAMISEQGIVKAAAQFGRLAKDSKVRALLRIPMTPAALANLIAQSATSEDDPTAASEALSTLTAVVGTVDHAVLAKGLAERMRSEEFSGPQLQGLVAVLDQLQTTESSRKTMTETLKELFEDGTLPHHLSRANQNSWFPQAASLSMLMLWASSSTTEPPAVRESAAGIQILRNVVANPSSNESLAAAQTEWLVQHSRWAVSYLLNRLTADPGTQVWVDYQLNALWDAGALRLPDDALANNSPIFKRALGQGAYIELCAHELEQVSSQEKLLVDHDSYELDLDLSNALDKMTDGSNASTVKEWLSERVARADKSRWDAALDLENGGPLVSLALSGVATHAASDLKDALLVHARNLQTGLPAWKPEPSTFTKLTALLSPETRQVLASQLCAGLEGLNGDFDVGFLNVYGDFLRSEPQFRDHQKLLNVVDALVAQDKWDHVNWFVDVADELPDILEKTGRATEYSSLRQRVEQKVRTSSTDLDPALVRLAVHLGVEIPKEAEHPGTAEDEISE